MPVGMEPAWLNFGNTKRYKAMTTPITRSMAIMTKRRFIGASAMKSLS